MENRNSSIRGIFRRPIVILVVAVGLTPITNWAATWTEINSGLPGNTVGVNTLAIDPASPSTLYALGMSSALGNAVAPSLFKTTDGGSSWREIGSVTGVLCLAIDPTKSSTIYAGTNQGVVKSTNSGESWTDVTNNLPGGSVLRLVIDPSTPSTLYAVANAPAGPPGGPIAAAIYKTTDGGSRWSALDTGLPSSAYITLLVIDPSTPSTLYSFAPPFFPPGAGSVPVGGLVKSVDGGQSWKTLNGLCCTTFINSMAVDPLASSTLYATGSGGLIKSVDGGETWNSISSALPQGINVSFLVIDRAAPSAIFAAGNSFAPAGVSSSILESTDGGAHWSTFKVGIPPNTLINTLVLDPTGPSGIYVGASGISLGFPPAQGGGAHGGVLKSTDGGATWSEATTGLITFDIRTLAINPVNSTIYVGGSGGTSRSTDGGMTWNGTGLSAYTGTLIADSVNPDTLYAFTGRANGCDSSEALLLSTTDGGANWSNAVSPLNSGCILNAAFFSPHTNPIAIDPTNPNTLYVGESDDQDGYSAVLKTTNKGAYWNAPWDWFNGLRGSVRAIAIDPVHSATLYAGIDDGSASLGPMSSGPDSSGLFRSTDGGATWANTGLTTRAVNVVAIDPANPQILYVGTEGHYSQPQGFQGLFKSTDGGKTWLAINQGLASLIGNRLITVNALVIDPSDSRVLYLGTSSGVFRSADGGTSWSSFNDGLTNSQIRTLAVAPGPSHAVYAVTAGGVFKYSPE